MMNLSCAYLSQLVVLVCLSLTTIQTAASERADDSLDITNAAIVVRGKNAPVAEQTAATVLAEEVEKRAGIRWTVIPGWVADKPVIVVTSGTEKTIHGKPVPEHLLTTNPESYAVATDVSEKGKLVIWIVGADPRGALFGVGRLLRNLDWHKGSVRLIHTLNVVTAPTYRIRGHQLGYRARANSYDAWDVAQYEQYIRELTFFGLNAIENIPFQDTDPSPHMKVARDVMNRELSRICDLYDLEYWVWTPATFDLNDADRRGAHLKEHEAFYASCARLDGVFFPGGDPGDNHPKLVMPFLQDLSLRLAKYHPRAKIWISLQGFDMGEVSYFFKWLRENNPDWLGGVVAGPSSPPIPSTRNRLPERYGLRSYPDITHTVRCQYPVPWWDPAFAFTLGREPINPRPVFYTQVHNFFAPYTDGFISYSDGINDDVNKTVWSALGWDPTADVREILIEYCRVFFGEDVAQEAADGIFSLERNWEGALATNGGVDATLVLWRSLETKKSELRDNWRWQSCLLRAYYDAYTRHRLIYETRLEQEVNGTLAQAKMIGTDAAMSNALAILKRADAERCRPELRNRIVELCDAMFRSIGLQTSVNKYQASGAERGAVLDFLDYPLNNRLWLEHEFDKVRTMPGETEKVARLETIRTWENPEPGSLYDDVGNVAKSPHVIRGEGINTDPDMVRNPNPDFWDAGIPWLRQSWVSKMDWPIGLRYEGLDPNATYVVRTTGYRQCLLRVNGVRINPTMDGKDLGDIKEFVIPKELYKNGTITLTFDIPLELELNWRVQSRLTELWLIKR